jgi:hypothetical protein
MIFRNLDENNDWEFGQGKTNYLSGAPAIGLNLKTRMLSWVGDCFFATKAGIDWANRLGSKNQYALLIADLKRLTLTSYGVTGLTSFNASQVVRALTVDEAVNTFYSQAYLQSLAQGNQNA